MGKVHGLRRVAAVALALGASAGSWRAQASEISWKLGVAVQRTSFLPAERRAAVEKRLGELLGLKTRWTQSEAHPRIEILETWRDAPAMAKERGLAHVLVLERVETEKGKPHSGTFKKPGDDTGRGVRVRFTGAIARAELSLYSVGDECVRLREWEGVLDRRQQPGIHFADPSKADREHVKVEEESVLVDLLASMILEGLDWQITRSLWIHSGELGEQLSARDERVQAVAWALRSSRRHVLPEIALARAALQSWSQEAESHVALRAGKPYQAGACAWCGEPGAAGSKPSCCPDASHLRALQRIISATITGPVSLSSPPQDLSAVRARLNPFAPGDPVSQQAWGEFGILLERQVRSLQEMLAKRLSGRRVDRVQPHRFRNRVILVHDETVELEPLVGIDAWTLADGLLHVTDSSYDGIRLRGKGPMLALVRVDEESEVDVIESVRAEAVDAETLEAFLFRALAREYALD